MKRFLALLLTLTMIISAFVIVPTAVNAAEDYRAWAQKDSRWSSIRLGSSPYTIGSDGCLVSSITKLIIQAGFRSADSFNIGTLANWLNSNGGYTSGGLLYWAKPSACVSGFNYYGKLLNNGTYYSTSYNSQLVSWVNSGYHITLQVSNGNHWIAIDEAKTKATGEVYIMDSSYDVRADLTLSSRYGTFNSAVAYTGGTSPNLGPTPLEFGTDFYAVLGNSDNSKAIGLDESNTVIVCPYKGTNDQRWHFIRQSDGGYKIINVCTDTYLVGDNIASLEYEAGHNNKVWYIMKDYSGEKLCLTHYSGETIKWLHPAWESWTDGTQITLNDAESCLNINIVNEFSYVNLGDNFYAMIANQSNNKAIGLDSDNNVKVFPYQGYNDEIWHFIRQNDGGYKVINVLTDTYLVGDNIVSLEYEAGHNNKIWYIMNGSSGSNLCLTHYSSGELRWLHPAYEYWEDGTQITLNDAESCVNINIVKGEGNKPEGFSIITEEQTITEGNSLKIEWNKSKFANQYNVSIWKDDGEHLVYTQTRNNSFVMNDLKAGYYGVYINAENHLGQTDYTSIHFTVVENTTEPTEPPTTPMEPTIPTEPKTIILGDVDGDSTIEIRDATWIQRHVTKEEMPFVINKTTADVDGDGIITVMDATAIQHYLANMKTSYKIGEKIE